MLDAIIAHANTIAEDAQQLAGALAEADEATLLPLVQAVALVDLEDVRARLTLAAEAMLAHAAPRHGKE